MITASVIKGLKILVHDVINLLCYDNETMFTMLTYKTPKLLSYKNQSIDLQSKSFDLFLYNADFGV